MTSASTSTMASSTAGRTRLLRIGVADVRNLREVAFEPHPRLNVIVGDNGQGKTNLLECIHLAAALRPLRSVERGADLVRHGADAGVIKARFEQGAGPLLVEIAVEKKGRRATLAGKACRDVSELARHVGVVSFLPEDLEVVRGGPGERRRALDRLAFSLEPAFADVARRFEALLERRNRVLKSAFVDEDVLDSYTTPFARAAAELSQWRARALDRWAPVFAHEARAIGGDALAARLSYLCAVDEGGARGADTEALAGRIEEALAAARDTELRKRTTAVGPQHDDVLVEKAERKARFLASQGEARALVLALKLSQLRLVTEARGAPPLLLLDDVAGELDVEKAARLWRAVDEHGAQTFVTATHRAALPSLLADGLLLRIVGGAIVDEGALA